MLYTIFQRIFKIAFKLLFRWEIYGVENVPLAGAAILAGNHTSLLDPPLLGTPVPRKLYFLARKDLFHPRPWGWLLQQIHTVPIERRKASVSSIKSILNLLKAGEVVVMFPEGTRGFGLRLGEVKKGLGLLVAKSGVPVVPAYISGAAEVLPRGARMIRPRKIRIIYGRPLTFIPSAGREHGPSAFQHISDRVMEEIAALERRLKSS